METSLRTGSETSEDVDVRGRPSPLMPTGQSSPLMPTRKPLRTWAGHGTGATCNGCGGSIEPHQIEYEIEMPQGSDAASLHFHFACYRDWTGRGI
jgi:hypothetical protein